MGGIHATADQRRGTYDLQGCTYQGVLSRTFLSIPLQSQEDGPHLNTNYRAELPPGTKPIHAGKNLEELIYARIHVGPVFA